MWRAHVSNSGMGQRSKLNLRNKSPHKKQKLEIILYYYFQEREQIKTQTKESGKLKSKPKINEPHNTQRKGTQSKASWASTQGPSTLFCRQGKWGSITLVSSNSLRSFSACAFSNSRLCSSSRIRACSNCVWVWSHRGRKEQWKWEKGKGEREREGKRRLQHHLQCTRQGKAVHNRRRIKIQISRKTPTKQKMVTTGFYMVLVVAICKKIESMMGNHPSVLETLLWCFPASRLYWRHLLKSKAPTTARPLHHIRECKDLAMILHISPQEESQGTVKSRKLPSSFCSWDSLNPALKKRQVILYIVCC